MMALLEVSGIINLLVSAWNIQWGVGELCASSKLAVDQLSTPPQTAFSTEILNLATGGFAEYYCPRWSELIKQLTAIVLSELAKAM